MNIKKRRAFHDEDAMSAMNDIMFFLMLFFLIISTLANPNIVKLSLPKSDNSDQLSHQPLSLTVNENLEYFIEKEKIPDVELEAALKGATSKSEDKTVVLRMAKNLTLQDLVNVMDIGAKLKLKLVLSTTK